MRRCLRINYIIIAAIFFLLAAAGVLVASLLGERLSKSALWYGSGTEDDPYRLYDANQLYNLRELSASPLASGITDGKYFSLEADMPVEGIIPASRYAFGGIFEGNGHTLTLGEQGLFETLKSGAAVRDLDLKLDLAFQGKSNVYGIAKTVQKDALIEDCNLYGKITLSFGSLPQTNPVGYVSSTFASAAPICVENNGTVRGCTFRGSIVQEDRTKGWGGCYIAGLVAKGSGIVESCAFEGEISVGVSTVYLGVGGLTFSCSVKDSTYTGNLTVWANEGWLTKSGIDYTFYVLHTKTSLSKGYGVFGLGRKAKDCAFTGDLIFDYRGIVFEREPMPLTANEDTSCTHTGESYTTNAP